MSSRAFQLSLLAAAFASCAPHVTIVDEGSGGASGDDSRPGSGTGGGGNAGGGGSAGTAGDGGAGIAGSGPPSCDHALPPEDDPEIMCAYTAAVGNYCSKGGCHGTSKAGGLDLRITGTYAAGFISRLVDQPAQHKISCTGPPLVTCDRFAMPTTCTQCSQCPMGDKLLDSADIPNSWVLKKLATYIPPMSGTTNVDMSCGDSMPSLLTAGISSYTQADKDCLIRFFRKIARTEGTFPCGAAGQ